MADYYFIYSVIDIIWKIFSILFVLYKFTSFFSMLYEFFKFLGKLLKGLIYVKDQIVIYIIKRNNYNFDDTDLPIRPKSFYTIFKEHCLKLYNKIFGHSNHNNTYLPLYETRTEYTNNFEESEHEVFNFSKNRHSIQTDEFNNLLNSNISIQSNNRVSSNLEFDIFNSYQTYKTSSSIYPPHPSPQKKEINVQNSFNLLNSEFIIGNNEKNKEKEIVNVFDESLLNEDDEESYLLFTPNI